MRGGETEAQLHIAGKLFPALRRTILTSEKCGMALTRVLDAAALSDFVVIAALGLGATPLLKGGRALAARRWPSLLGTWDGSYVAICARGLRRLAKWMCVLYAVDLSCLAAHTIGLPIRTDLPLIAASFAYPIWLARVVSALKAKFLGMREKMPSDAAHIEAGVDGRVLVYNRLLDFAIGVFAAVGALEVLSLELGVAFTSLIAVSGVSSVVVALACQEPLSHLINGLLLTFNDKFRPGDEVQFGDVAGFVTSMGWFDTHVRRYDESTVQIPNGKIMGEKVTNKSRQTWGQYKTELRIRLEDVPQMEAVVATVKAALATMPEVIQQGRNLWVHWRAIEKDACRVVVDLKLRAAGGSTPYYDLVEQCNVRIARAVRDAGADFALPTSRRV